MPHLMAFLGVALAIWVLRPFALRAGLADLPGGRRQHADAVPLVGGVAIALGANLFDEFLALKRMEWIEYSRHVSAWEQSRYLEFF